MSPQDQAPWPADFDPRYFSHGRLLWRFPGSDGARFSPRLAWRLLVEATGDGSERTLWDPFCGIGLIGSLARLFFHDRINGVLASDINPTAAATASKNLELVSRLSTASHRLEQVRALRGQNLKSDRRWQEIEEYLERLQPRIAAAQARDLPTRAFVGPAADIPPVSSPIAIVADAPYGGQSTLVGPPLPELLAHWMNAPTVARIDLVLSGSPEAPPSNPSFEQNILPVRGQRWLFRAHRHPEAGPRPPR